MIEATIARIIELGYLDDNSYAARRALILAEKGYGDFAIRIFLEGIGLPESFVTSAMSALPKDLGERKRIKKIIREENRPAKGKAYPFPCRQGLPH